MSDGNIQNLRPANIADLDCINCKKKFEVVKPKLTEVTMGHVAHGYAFSKEDAQFCPYCGAAYRPRMQLTTMIAPQGDVIVIGQTWVLTNEKAASLIAVPGRPS